MAVIRAAITQATWTGDKESMIAKHGGFLRVVATASAQIEQSTAANQYFIASNNRIGTESNEFGDLAVTFYGSSYFVDPRGNFVGVVASTDSDELVIRDLDLNTLREVRNA